MCSPYRMLGTDVGGRRSKKSRRSMMSRMGQEHDEEHAMELGLGLEQDIEQDVEEDLEQDLEQYVGPGQRK